MEGRAIGGVRGEKPAGGDVVPSLGEEPETDLGALHRIVRIVWRDVLVVHFNAGEELYDDRTRSELIAGERRGETDLTIEGRSHIVGTIEQDAVIVILAISTDRPDPPPRGVESLAEGIAPAHITACVVVAGLEAREHLRVGRFGLGMKRLDQRRKQHGSRPQHPGAAACG
ncbi:MAG TPA: hypothetical protein VMW05_09540 [Methyloceanibacter sp.]|nr:hypothetical protein [Methyloceanibacter sp.]